MKKILFFLLLSGVLSAQSNEVIDFKYRLNDPKSTTKSLEVIDAREDKNIGQYSRKDKIYTFSFPTDNAKSDLENWFEKDNKKRGKRELVIVLDKLKVYEKKGIDKVDYAKIFISASSYEKVGTEYFLLKTIDGTKTINTWEYQNISKTLASSIGMSLNKFITESYSLEPSKISVPQDQLPNYREYLAENLPVFKTNQFQDGIYKDYLSFFNQKPLTGYQLIKDKDGNVIRAEGKNETLRPPQQIFIYVENGIAYKSTFGGFYKIDKDEKGFYIFSGITLLNQGLAKHDFTPPGGGAIAGGLGALGNVLLSNEQRKALEKEEKEKVYISPLTGEYLFEY
ncbi:hypothetical protein GCM10023210_19570 [Chryseobacterium ginsengisoli]|uniref:Uncharacterized protein n=1 Tax=Chryseobacterium ginsengisoli TaxID=363853 RepID=A0ABP9M9U1_9FLAO